MYTVIRGLGPVGLAFALVASRYDSKKHPVLAITDRKTYSREQMLLLEDDVIDFVRELVGDSAVDKLIKEGLLKKKLIGHRWLPDEKRWNMQICTLEQLLFSALQEQGKVNIIEIPRHESDAFSISWRQNTVTVNKKSHSENAGSQLSQFSFSCLVTTTGECVKSENLSYPMVYYSPLAVPFTTHHATITYTIYDEKKISLLKIGLKNGAREIGAVDNQKLHDQGWEYLSAPEARVFEVGSLPCKFYIGSECPGNLTNSPDEVHQWTQSLLENYFSKSFLGNLSLSQNEITAATRFELLPKIANFNCRQVDNDPNVFVFLAGDARQSPHYQTASGAVSGLREALLFKKFMQSQQTSQDMDDYNIACNDITAEKRNKMESLYRARMCEEREAKFNLSKVAEYKNEDQFSAWFCNNAAEIIDKTIQRQNAGDFESLWKVLSYLHVLTFFADQLPYPFIFDQLIVGYRSIKKESPHYLESRSRLDQALSKNAKQNSRDIPQDLLINFISIEELVMMLINNDIIQKMEVLKNVSFQWEMKHLVSAIQKNNPILVTYILIQNNSYRLDSTVLREICIDKKWDAFVAYLSGVTLSKLDLLLMITTLLQYGCHSEIMKNLANFIGIKFKNIYSPLEHAKVLNIQDIHVKKINHKTVGFVKDHLGRWFPVEIIDSDKANKNRVKIHYQGWDSRYDEWINENSDRFQKLRKFEYLANIFKDFCSKHAALPRELLLMGFLVETKKIKAALQLFRVLLSEDIIQQEDVFKYIPYFVSLGASTSLIYEFMSLLNTEKIQSQPKFSGVLAREIVKTALQGNRSEFLNDFIKTILYLPNSDFLLILHATLTKARENTQTLQILISDMAGITIDSKEYEDVKVIESAKNQAKQLNVNHKYIEQINHETVGFVKDHFSDWYPVKIVDANKRNKASIKIHYQGWGGYYDEWIDEDSNRFCELMAPKYFGDKFKNFCSKQAALPPELQLIGYFIWSGQDILAVMILLILRLEEIIHDALIIRHIPEFVKLGCDVSFIHVIWISFEDEESLENLKSLLLKSDESRIQLSTISKISDPSFFVKSKELTDKIISAAIFYGRDSFLRDFLTAYPVVFSVSWVELAFKTKQVKCLEYLCEYYFIQKANAGIDYNFLCKQINARNWECLHVYLNHAGITKDTELLKKVMGESIIAHGDDVYLSKFIHDFNVPITEEWVKIAFNKIHQGCFQVLLASLKEHGHSVPRFSVQFLESQIMSYNWKGLCVYFEYNSSYSASDFFRLLNLLLQSESRLFECQYLCNLLTLFLINEKDVFKLPLFFNELSINNTALPDALKLIVHLIFQYKDDYALKFWNLILDKQILTVRQVRLFAPYLITKGLTCRFLNSLVLRTEREEKEEDNEVENIFLGFPHDIFTQLVESAEMENKKDIVHWAAQYELPQEFLFSIAKAGLWRFIAQYLQGKKLTNEDTIDGIVQLISNSMGISAPSRIKSVETAIEALKAIISSIHSPAKIVSVMNEFQVFKSFESRGNKKHLMSFFYQKNDSSAWTDIVKHSKKIILERINLLVLEKQELDPDQLKNIEAFLGESTGKISKLFGIKSGSLKIYKNILDTSIGLVR